MCWATSGREMRSNWAKLFVLTARPKAGNGFCFFPVNLRVIARLFVCLLACWLTWLKVNCRFYIVYIYCIGYSLVDHSTLDFGLAAWTACNFLNYIACPIKCCCCAINIHKHIHTHTSAEPLERLMQCAQIEICLKVCCNFNLWTCLLARTTALQWRTHIPSHAHTLTHTHPHTNTHTPALTRCGANVQRTKACNINFSH